MREDDKRAIVEQTPLQTSTDVALYFALLSMVSKSAEVGPSTAYLTRVLQVDRRTVMRSFRRLEAAGLVVSTQTAPGRGVRRLLPCIQTWTEPKGGRRWACDLTARQGEAERSTDKEPAPTPEAPSQAAMKAAPSADREPALTEAEIEKARQIDLLKQAWAAARDQRRGQDAARPPAAAHTPPDRQPKPAAPAPHAANADEPRPLPANFEPTVQTWVKIEAIGLPRGDFDYEYCAFLEHFGPNGRGRKSRARDWNVQLVEWLKDAKKGSGPYRPGSPLIGSRMPSFSPPPVTGKR